MKPCFVKNIKKVFWVLFCCYLGLMLYFLFFSENLNRSQDIGYRYNLEFFREVRRSFWCYKAGNTSYFILNFLMNIIAFIPCGFFWPLLSKNKHARNFFYVMLSVLEFVVTVEVVQLVTRTGTFDIDDIMLNTFGGMIGYLIFYTTHLMYQLKRKVMK